jgi:hypothetical protein
VEVAVLVDAAAAEVATGVVLSIAAKGASPPSHWGAVV